MAINNTLTNGQSEASSGDLLAAMQPDPSLNTVPRIVLTGQDDPLVRAEAVALGALEVHAKPLDPVAMTQAIA